MDDEQGAPPPRADPLEPVPRVRLRPTRGRFAFGAWCDSGHTYMAVTAAFLIAATVTAERAESTTPSAVIDRVSLVLEAFDGPGRLTLAQLVRRTGLPRSSAHRMLERLVALRWLRRSGRDYELGMRLVELGSLAVHQDRLHRRRAAYIQRTEKNKK